MKAIQRGGTCLASWKMRHRESPPRDPRFSVPPPFPSRELRRHIFLTSSSGQFATVLLLLAHTCTEMSSCNHVMYMYDVVCGTADQSDEPCAFLGKRFVFPNQREPPWDRTTKERWCGRIVCNGRNAFIWDERLLARQAGRCRHHVVEAPRRRKRARKRFHSSFRRATLAGNLPERAGLATFGTFSLTAHVTPFVY